MDISKLSHAVSAPVIVPPLPKPEADAQQDILDSKFRWVPIAPIDAEEPRPIPVITAEIIRDMDNLCNWLHEMQRVHSAMSKLRAERREAALNAVAQEQSQAASAGL